MRDDELIEKLQQGLERQREHPRELWDALIRDGIIDVEGNVLVRVPEGPSAPQPGKKPANRKGTGSLHANGDQP